MEQIDRRSLLKASAGVALASATGGVMLSGCSSGADAPTASTSNTAGPATSTGAGPAGGSARSSSTSPSAGSGGVTLPTYVPRDVVKPDLPGDSTGIVPDGFFTYPQNLAAANSGTPGRGGDISLITAGSGQGVPPPVSRNKFWAELNKRLGVNLKAQVSPSRSDYTAKLPTLLAGNDLPDLIQIFPSINRLPDIAKAKFQDISEHIAGDAIKKYPNLAAIATTSWRNSMIDGRFYGVVCNQLIPYVMLVRSDIAESRGVDVAGIKTFDDFFDACKAFTDTRKSTYAAAFPDGLIIFVKESCGVPNGWREEDGKFTWSYETAELKDALTAFSQLWKAGVLHPDSFTNSNDIYSWLVSGRTAMMENSLNNLAYIATLTGASEAKFESLAAPSYHGATPVALGTAGLTSVTALKKTNDKDRVAELLAVLDWLAAPFGSEEQQFCFYGIPGVDFTLKDGQPVETATGQNELRLYLYVISRCNGFLYFAGRPDDVKSMHDYAAQIKPRVIFDPTAALYSPTASSIGPSLNKEVADVETDIMQGRKPVSAIDAAVERWRKNGGDKIRQEYEEAFQRSS